MVYFGDKDSLTGTSLDELRSFYLGTSLVGCCTGGEIHNAEVLDKSIVAAAVKLEKTKIVTAHKITSDRANPFAFERWRKLPLAQATSDKTEAVAEAFSNKIPP